MVSPKIEKCVDIRTNGNYFNGQLKFKGSDFNAFMKPQGVYITNGHRLPP